MHLYAAVNEHDFFLRLLFFFLGHTRRKQFPHKYCMELDKIWVEYMPFWSAMFRHRITLSQACSSRRDQWRRESGASRDLCPDRKRPDPGCVPVDETGQNLRMKKVPQSKFWGPSCAPAVKKFWRRHWARRHELLNFQRIDR
jgi:hypothetical protein